jgi:hypothetical protein
VIDLRIADGDVTAEAAQAILLPIDGMLPKLATLGEIERSLGRVARMFARRFPELAEEMESQINFPLPLGRAAPVELEGRHAIAMSMLAHHAAHTGDGELRAAMSGAFAHALQLCDELGLASASAPLLKGGWRLSTEQAMSAMLNVIGGARPRHPLSLTICILDAPAESAAMRQIAASLGFKTN